MANMSYCRFENTLSDFVDCLDALEDMDLGEIHRLSKTEEHAAHQLLDKCVDIVAAMCESLNMEVHEIDYDDIGQYLDHIQATAKGSPDNLPSQDGEYPDLSNER